MVDIKEDFPRAHCIAGDNSSLLGERERALVSRVGLQHPKWRNKSSRIGGRMQRRLCALTKEGGGARRSSRLIPVKNATQVNPGEEIAARENRIFNGHRCLHVLDQVCVP